jgi:hypothetical protein
MTDADVETENVPAQTEHVQGKTLEEGVNQRLSRDNINANPVQTKVKRTD